MPHLNLKTSTGKWLTEWPRWTSLPPAERPKMPMVGARQGEKRGLWEDWKRGTALVRGATGDVHRGGNLFGTIKASQERKRPTNLWESRRLLAGLAKDNSLAPHHSFVALALALEEPGTPAEKRNMQTSETDGTTMALLRPPGIPPEGSPQRGKRVFKWSAEIWRWPVPGHFNYWNEAFLCSECLEKSRGLLRLLSGPRGEEATKTGVSGDNWSKRRAALYPTESSSDVAAAFSYCGKRHIKLTMLSMFNCVLRWHRYFTLFCNHHHHTSTLVFHLSKWKLHFHSVMCNGCILRSKYKNSA